MEDDTSKRYQSADQAMGAIASLPAIPAWQAEVEPDKIRWELVSNGRLNVVEWKRTPRQNEWVAWSEPSNGAPGRKRTLGRSNGVISAKQAISDLEKYLGA